MAGVCGEPSFLASGTGENRERGKMMDAQEVKQIVKAILPRIERLMALEVATWEQLTVEQQEELNMITLGGLQKIDIKKVRILGHITSAEYGKLLDFCEWEKALGGFED
jgi:hypothetical protein